MYDDPGQFFKKIAFDLQSVFANPSVVEAIHRVCRFSCRHFSGQRPDSKINLFSADVKLYRVSLTVPTCSLCRQDVNELSFRPGLFTPRAFLFKVASLSAAACRR